ncbi:glycosyltransferase family 4 protein [Cohnella lubricantis]|uniref:Glycosyltransferase family 4 protein n=1 Tax=Cohnella lubricantis TaxID=2163172 RepID=A0A841T778_9BACL|nr:glycosyltransferase family 4 protein [Cohnella lubricantis]MBB6675906.1 glycosyltransferase family 4 protein [Cohnella lubricantis]MBP2117177.1 glycosyltransferase involved in cell wall biosynthesis [Cohnella lubricantis]
MKLTFPILTLCKGGAQRMLAELVNGLVRKGHDVTIVMPSEGVIEYPVQARVIQTTRTVLRADDLPSSDAIVSNYYLTVPLSQAASEQGKGRHIRLSMCYEPVVLPNNHQSFPTYFATQSLIVISSWQQKLIELLHGIRGTVVPVGLDPVFRNLHIREQSRTIRISAIVREPEGFAFHRDQHYLMEELYAVKRDYPHVEIALITPPGEMYRSPALQRMRATLPYLFYTPGDDVELCYHYNQSHIFVTSSIYEAANMPGLEAMRCGAALVSAYSGGNTDYGRHGHTCLVAYRHEGSLGQQIRLLLNRPELMQSIAAAGEQESQKWTWARSVNAFDQALREYLFNR